MTNKPNLTPETLEAYAAEADKGSGWGVGGGILRSHASAWRAQLAADRKRLERYKELLRAMKRRDPNLDEVWMEQFATQELAALAVGEEKPNGD